MSAFDAAMDRAKSAINAALAESLRITPMTAGEFMGDAEEDDEREVRDVRGVVLEGPDRVRVTDNVVGREFDNRYVVAPILAVIDADELTTEGALILPRKGDRVDRLDCGDRLEISVIEPDGAGAYILRMMRVAS